MKYKFNAMKSTTTKSECKEIGGVKTVTKTTDITLKTDDALKTIVTLGTLWAEEYNTIEILHNDKIAVFINGNTKVIYIAYKHMISEALNDALEIIAELDGYVIKRSDEDD